MSDFDSRRPPTDDPQPADRYDEAEADLAVRAPAGLLRNSAVMATGWVFNFMIGGLTGIFHADVATDLQLHDTYFVVAHFHFTIIGGSIRKSRSMPPGAPRMLSLSPTLVRSRSARIVSMRSGWPSTSMILPEMS